MKNNIVLSKKSSEISEKIGYDFSSAIRKKFVNTVTAEVGSNGYQIISILRNQLYNIIDLEIHELMVDYEKPRS